MSEIYNFRYEWSHQIYNWLLNKIRQHFRTGCSFIRRWNATFVLVVRQPDGDSSDARKTIVFEHAGPAELFHAGPRPATAFVRRRLQVGRRILVWRRLRPSATGNNVSYLKPKLSTNIFGPPTRHRHNQRIPLQRPLRPRTRPPPLLREVGSFTFTSANEHCLN